MKHSSKRLILVLALLLATSAFASGKGSFHLSQPISVNGQTLPAGSYKASWDAKGPTFELNITQGKKVVATVPARMVELPRAYDNDATIMVTNSDGTRSLSEIRFSGKKYAIGIGSEQAKAGGMSASSQ